MYFDIVLTCCSPENAVSSYRIFSAIYGALSLSLSPFSPAASIHFSAALAFSATQSFISFHRPQCIAVHAEAVCAAAKEERRRKGIIMFHLFSAQDKYDEEAAL